MALISSYENDIFISYAHVDNQMIKENEKGWVTLFHRHLELELARIIGRIDKIAIWNDRELDGAQRFNPVIERAIDESAIFIALTSHGFLHSESYCSKELQHFYKKAGDDGIGLTVDKHKRIIHVLLYDISHDKLPLQFAGATGFEFFNGEGDYSSPSEPGKKRFKKQLTPLLAAIKTILEGFPTSVSEPKVVNEAVQSIAESELEPVSFMQDESLGRQTQNSTQPQRAVLLDFHSKDHEHARTMSRFLVDNGFDVLIGPDADPDTADPISNFRIYEERLKQVGNLIIFWGDVSRDWTKERLTTALHILIEERLPDMKFGVYDTSSQRTATNFDLGIYSTALLKNQKQVLSFLQAS